MIDCRENGRWRWEENGGGVLKNGWIFLLGVHLMKIKNESSEAYLIV